MPCMTIVLFWLYFVITNWFSISMLMIYFMEYEINFYEVNYGVPCYWSLGYSWSSKSWKCTTGKKMELSVLEENREFAFLKCGSFGFHCICRESGCKAAEIVTSSWVITSSHFQVVKCFFFLSFIFTHYLCRSFSLPRVSL